MEVNAVFPGNRSSHWRCLAVWMTGTSSLGAGAVVLRAAERRAWLDRGSLASLPLDRVLSDLAGGALLLCLGWAWVALTAAVAEAWRGVAPARRGAFHPSPAVRRVVLAACGVALVSATASPAVAAGAPGAGAAGHRDRPARLHGAALLSGLPLPERAVAPRRTPHRVSDGDVVVIRPGDSLWTIACRDLAPGASAAAVTERWHAIYAANRAVIGPDPDLIRPGQRLLLPRKDPS
jgi:hypothetical protein